MAARIKREVRHQLLSIKRKRFKKEEPDISLKEDREVTGLVRG